MSGPVPGNPTLIHTHTALAFLLSFFFPAGRILGEGVEGTWVQGTPNPLLASQEFSGYFPWGPRGKGFSWQPEVGGVSGGLVPGPHPL